MLVGLFRSSMYQYVLTSKVVCAFGFLKSLRPLEVNMKSVKLNVPVKEFMAKKKY
jgi:hypothetical protein